MQAVEVTQGQYEGLMGENPSGFVDCGADAGPSVLWMRRDMPMPSVLLRN